MGREIVIDHEKLSDPQSINPVTRQIFKDKGVDIDKVEVTGFEDDGDGDKGGKRIVKLRSKTFFDMGRKR